MRSGPVVIEGRNRLQAGAIEINRAARDGIGIASGGEGARHANGSAGGQSPRAGGAAGQVAVILRGDGLSPATRKFHRAGRIKAIAGECGQWIAPAELQPRAGADGERAAPADLRNGKSPRVKRPP